MNKDEYGEVINGEETYNTIATLLHTGQPALIGWTDEDGTHFDILFTRKAFKEGIVQGGIKWDDMFISIMRLGAFGFKVENKDTAPGYYAEKLGYSGTSTTEKLAELFNEIKNRL